MAILNPRSIRLCSLRVSAEDRIAPSLCHDTCHVKITDFASSKTYHALQLDNGLYSSMQLLEMSSTTQRARSGYNMYPHLLPDLFQQFWPDQGRECQ